VSIPPSDVALRADAQRNRRLLLEAAALAFAEGGIDVPAEEVARRAGVAKGTLFRHFPTKTGLIAAVLRDRMAQLRRLIGEVEAERPPGLGVIAEVMARGAAILATDLSFFDAAAARVDVHRELLEEKLALEAAFDRLVAASQASGEVRPDIRGIDIALLMMAATNTCAPTRDLSPELYRRYLTLMIDGLRAGPTTPLPVPPMTGAQMHALTASAAA
jgi:AcrR family transcriptional regulator